MTPSNPDNQQPLIYRIADALGITHLVVAVQHSHLMSEIDGLVSALAAKANAVPAGSPTGGIVIANTAGELSRSNKTLNDLMPVMTIDSTPTASSDNLVTSGGVAAALAAKMDNKTIDSTPTANSTNLVTSGGVKAALEGKANKVDVMYSVFEKSDENENIELDNVFSDGHETSHFILINRMGEQIKVSDFFYTQYGELVENGHTLSNDSTAIVKIIHYSDGSAIRFYMVVEEIFEA